MAKKNVTMWLEPEWVERIDRLAEKAELSRARILENIVKMNIEELELVDKVGFFQFSKILKDLREGIRAWSEGLIMERGQLGSKGR
jgi:predicted DNA-binding protein